MAIGMQDTAGARAVAMGLYSPQNVMVAYQASQGYVEAVDMLKNMTDLELTPEQLE